MLQRERNARKEQGEMGKWEWGGGGGVQERCYCVLSHAVTCYNDLRYR